jgi:hypothetical protein
METPCGMCGSRPAEPREHYSALCSLCERCAERYTAWDCPTCGTSMGGVRELAGTLCHICEGRAAWSTLPPQAQAKIDDLLCSSDSIGKVFDVVREYLGQSRTIDLGRRVYSYRHGVLSEQGRIKPKPDTMVEDALAKVKALNGRPVAIEARWLDESRGWCVGMGVILRRPSRWHPLFDERSLAWFPPRAANGRSAAEEATSKGQAVADELGVPFHFADPDTPDTGYPRWWDTLVTDSAN